MPTYTFKQIVIETTIIEAETLEDAYDSFYSGDVDPTTTDYSGDISVS